MIVDRIEDTELQLDKISTLRKVIKLNSLVSQMHHISSWSTFIIDFPSLPNGTFMRFMNK